MAIKDWSERPKTQPGDRFLIIEEVAALMRTSVKTVRRYHALGELPASYRYGKRHIWLERTFLEWIDEKWEG